MLLSPSLQTLDDMINKKTATRARAWLTIDGMEIYIRITRRQATPCIELANMRSPAVSRGTGRFWRFIAYLHSKYPTHMLYAENVHNARLAASLQKRGWSIINYIPGPPCFMLMIDGTIPCV